MAEINEVLIKKSAQDQLRKVPSKLRRQSILATIKGLAAEAHPETARQLLPSGLFRIRTGDWRVIYFLNTKKVTVLTIKDGHRLKDYAR